MFLWYLKLPLHSTFRKQLKAHVAKLKLKSYEAGGGVEWECGGAVRTSWGRVQYNRLENHRTVETTGQVWKTQRFLRLQRTFPKELKEGRGSGRGGRGRRAKGCKVQCRHCSAMLGTWGITLECQSDGNLLTSLKASKLLEIDGSTHYPSLLLPLSLSPSLSSFLTHSKLPFCTSFEWLTMRDSSCISGDECRATCHLQRSLRGCHNLLPLANQSKICTRNTNDIEFQFDFLCLKSL